MLQASPVVDTGNVPRFLYHQTMDWWIAKGRQEIKQIDNFIQGHLRLPTAEKRFGGPKWGAGPRWGTIDYMNSCAIDTLLFLSLWWWDDSGYGQGLKQRVLVRNTPATIMAGHFQDCLLRMSRVLTRKTINKLMNDLKHCFWGSLATESKNGRLPFDVPYLSTKDIAARKKELKETQKLRKQTAQTSNIKLVTREVYDQNLGRDIQITEILNEDDEIEDDESDVMIVSSSRDSANEESREPIIKNANFMSFSALAIPFLKAFGEIRMDYTWTCSKTRNCNNQGNPGYVYYSHIELLLRDIGEDEQLSSIVCRKLQHRGPLTRELFFPRTNKPCAQCGNSSSRRGPTKGSVIKYTFGQQCIININIGYDDIKDPNMNKYIFLAKTILIEDVTYDLSDFVVRDLGHYFAYRRLRPYTKGKWIKYDGMNHALSDGFTKALDKIELRRPLHTVEFVRYVRNPM